MWRQILFKETFKEKIVLGINVVYRKIKQINEKAKELINQVINENINEDIIKDYFIPFELSGNKYHAGIFFIKYDDQWDEYMDKILRLTKNYTHMLVEEKQVQDLKIQLIPKKQEKIKFKVNDNVTIINGAYTNIQGTVCEIKDTVYKINISIFNSLVEIEANEEDIVHSVS